MGHSERYQRATGGRFAAPADVVATLRRRAARRLCIRARFVKREDHQLFVAVTHHFRVWGRALQAAGFDPERVSCRRRWSKRRVVLHVQHLHAMGVPLNYASVKRHDAALPQAARKRFGCWDNALIAAGYDADSVRIQRRPWTKSQLIVAIRQRAVAGDDLTPARLRTSATAAAAERLFGSFRAAMRAAGVFHMTRIRSRWSRSRVLDAIRRRWWARKAVNSAAIIRSEPRLYDAARRHVGSWDRALAAAGIDSDGVRRRHRPWTPKLLLAEIRRRSREGEHATCVSSIRPISFVAACNRFYGSWNAALAAAGFDPEQSPSGRRRSHNLPVQRWSKKRKPLRTCKSGASTENP